MTYCVNGRIAILFPYIKNKPETVLSLVEIRYVTLVFLLAPLSVKYHITTDSWDNVITFSELWHVALLVLILFAKMLSVSSLYHQKWLDAISIFWPLFQSSDLHLSISVTNMILHDNDDSSVMTQPPSSHHVMYGSFHNVAEKKGLLSQKHSKTLTGNVLKSNPNDGDYADCILICMLPYNFIDLGCQMETVWLHSWVKTTD